MFSPSLTGIIIIILFFFLSYKSLLFLKTLSGCLHLSLLGSLPFLFVTLDNLAILGGDAPFIYIGLYQNQDRVQLSLPPPR